MVVHTPAPAPVVVHTPAPAPVVIHTPAPAPAPVQTPQPVYVVPPAPVAPAPQAVPNPADLIEPIYVQTPPPASVHPVQPAPVQAPQVFFAAPPANLRGATPEPGSARLYRLQVGSFSVPRNAVDVFERLRDAGLSPAYERNEDFYRVVLANIRADDIPSIAQMLGNLGFREAIVREEN